MPAPFTSFPSPNHSPTPTPVLPGVTLQVNYWHSNPASGYGAGGTQLKTDTVTKSDSYKEGEGYSATSHEGFSEVTTEEEEKLPSGNPQDSAEQMETILEILNKKG